jgi:hypothetical protein
VVEETQETEEIIERVAVVDVGKAELTCCARVPLKLSVVASDSFGVSGRAMLAALLAGARPQGPRAAGPCPVARQVGPPVEAFCGFFTDRHAFLLAKMLARVDALDADLAELDAKLAELIGPFAGAVERLDEIPGIGQTAAQLLIAEIGVDMSRFPTARHLVSWAEYAPIECVRRKREGSGSTGHGNPWLARVLGEAAVAASKTNTFLRPGAGTDGAGQLTVPGAVLARGAPPTSRVRSPRRSSRLSCQAGGVEQEARRTGPGSSVTDGWQLERRTSRCRTSRS